MGQNHVGLTEPEVELLTMIAEEAAEIVQACTKALRHGLSSRHPDGGPNNATQLSVELGQLGALATVAHFAGVVPAPDPSDGVLWAKLRYAHNQQPIEHAWRYAQEFLDSLSWPAYREDLPEEAEDWMAREGRLAQYGDLDAGVPNHHDPSRRGFDPA